MKYDCTLSVSSLVENKSPPQFSGQHVVYAYSHTCMMRTASPQTQTALFRQLIPLLRLIQAAPDSLAYARRHQCT